MPALAGDSPDTDVWHSLPVGHVSRVPRAKDAPKSIPAGQRADGFWAVRPQWMKENADYVMASVTGSASLIERASKGSAGDEDIPAACVTNGPFNGSDTDGDEEASGGSGGREWGGSMQAIGMLTWQKSLGAYAQRVQPVHLERLVEAGGAVTLEYVDAWVDVATLGSRGIGKGALPLVRVAAGPAGAAVFAARDGEERVEFVVRVDPATATGTAPFVRNQMRSLTGAVAPFGFLSSDCGFLRLPLRSSRGSGETATVSSRVMLPPLPTTPPGTVRLRPLLFHLSASQSTADREPVLSVAPAWEDREEPQRFSVEEEED
jgi:hypothetical protein